MQITILPNGDIEMRADAACRKRIRRLIKFFGGSSYAAEAAFLADEFRCRATTVYQQTAPCSVGALTSAAIITDGINVWGDMNYQVQSFLEELAAGRTVTWKKG